MPAKPVIVLGMHRSGTSLLAHLVHSAGVSAGDPKDLRPASKANQDGFWEKQQVADFSDTLLKAAGASWVAPPQSPETVAALGKENNYLIEARRLIDSMPVTERSWMWKDPKLSLLLPFWRDLLADAVYVVAIRNPVSIGLSLTRRDGFPPSAAILLWQVYMISILRDLPRGASVLFVSYEQLLSSPLAGCSRLIDFLRSTSRITDEQGVETERLSEIVRKSLCHSGADPDDSSLLDDAQQRLYALLVRLANDTDTLVTDTLTGVTPLNYPLYPGWRDYLQLWDRVFTFVLRQDRMRFRLFRESGSSRSLRDAVKRER